MQRSTVVRFSAWPARYTHPAARARQRRLGLHPGSGFVTAPTRQTELVGRGLAPLAALRAPWRSPVIEPAAGAAVRAASPVSWTGAGRAAGPRRTSVAPAWRA